MCLPSPCFYHNINNFSTSHLSAVERHQSEAEGFSAAEAGGLASGLHHSPFHTCHPAGLLHPGRPAGLRGALKTERSSRGRSTSSSSWLSSTPPPGYESHRVTSIFCLRLLPLPSACVCLLQAVTIHRNKYGLTA